MPRRDKDQPSRHNRDERKTTNRDQETYADALPGLVIRAYGKFFDAELADGRILLSTIRGTLKRDRRKTDLVAAGDRVQVIDTGEGEGQIVAVEPRTRVLARRARLTEDTEQIILANPDRALFVFAVRDPEPHRRMLDRFLVLAESRSLPSTIVLNKIDLDIPQEQGGWELATPLARIYEPFYPVFCISTHLGTGIDPLRAHLDGQITVVAGPSGVGKSTLLNRLDQGARETAEISGATGKGRHTTTGAVLRRLPGQTPTWVADTPGIRALSLQGVEAEDLPWCFPELRPYLDGCYYADCTHLHEPGCAVRLAVEARNVPDNRYQSYAALRRGDPDD